MLIVATIAAWIALSLAIGCAFSIIMRRARDRAEQRRFERYINDRFDGLKNLHNGGISNR